MTVERVGAAAPPGGLALTLGVRLIGVALTILAVQTAFWFEQGHWTAFNLGGVLAAAGERPLSVEWLPAQAILERALDCPLSALLAASGALLAWRGTAGRIG